MLVVLLMMAKLSDDEKKVFKKKKNVAKLFLNLLVWQEKSLYYGIKWVG